MNEYQMHQEDLQEAFRHKVIEELHEINLSLRKMSGRDVKEEKPSTYADFYFGNGPSKED